MNPADLFAGRAPPRMPGGPAAPLSQKRTRTESAPTDAKRPEKRRVEETDADELTTARMLEIAANLERAAERNLDLRTRYADEPLRFLESEADLDAALQTAVQITDSPAFYSEWRGRSSVAAAVALLDHANSDIAGKAASFWSELLDHEDEAPEPALAEFASLLLSEHNLAARLAQFPARADADADHAFAALQALEYLAELVPEKITAVLADSGALAWCLAETRRGSGRTADGQLGQYAVELLALGAQAGGRNVRVGLVSQGAVAALLGELAAFARKSPNSDEAREYAANAFDATGALLLEAEGRAAFSAEEGSSLMLVMVRRRTAGMWPRAFRTAALAMIVPDDSAAAANAREFVDAGGLGHLFPVLRRRDPLLDEAALSILRALFHTFAAGRGFSQSQRAALQRRIAAKFLEQRCVNVDQLVFVFLHYLKSASRSVQVELAALALVELYADDLVSDEVGVVFSQAPSEFAPGLSAAVTAALADMDPSAPEHARISAVVSSERVQGFLRGASE